jgi:hypothetical protein
VSGSKDAGIGCGATVNSGITYSNTERRTIKDVDVRNLSDNVFTRWSLDFNNLNEDTLSKHAEPIPASKSTYSFFDSWVTQFPNAAAGVNQDNRNDADDIRGMLVEIRAGWEDVGYWQGQSDYEVASIRPDIPIEIFGVKSPSRIATGYLDITNKEAVKYVQEIKAYSTTDVSHSKPYTVSNANMAPGNTNKLWLPVGDYNIQVNVKGEYYHTTQPFTVTRADGTAVNVDTNPEATDLWVKGAI